MGAVVSVISFIEVEEAVFVDVEVVDEFLSQHAVFGVAGFLHAHNPGELRDIDQTEFVHFRQLPEKQEVLLSASGIKSPKDFSGLVSVKLPVAISIELANDYFRRVLLDKTKYGRSLGGGDFAICILVQQLPDGIDLGIDVTPRPVEEDEGFA